MNADRHAIGGRCIEGGTTIPVAGRPDGRLTAELAHGSATGIDRAVATGIGTRGLRRMPGPSRAVNVVAVRDGG